MSGTAGADVRRFRVGDLEVRVFADGASLARSAASDAIDALRGALAVRPRAAVMFATGNSQLAFLAELVARRAEVDWDRVAAFHMDEYVGLAPTHPASFQRYLRERVGSRLPLAAFHYLAGDAADPEAEAARYAALLVGQRLDLCCLGIGENGHLAFNDPSVADFADPLTVKVVSLDDACRHQQVGEGHFPTMSAVPERAITVTIPALLAARRVLAVVPEARKAEPVRGALEGPLSPACPASALRGQAQATLYLDTDSAALLAGGPG